MGLELCPGQQGQPASGDPVHWGYGKDLEAFATQMTVKQEIARLFHSSLHTTVSRSSAPPPT